MSGGLYSMEEKDFDRTLDLSKVKPYGDTMNDGKMQISFTLPVPPGAEAEEAAKMLLKEMGLTNPMVVFSKELTEGFTFFNCYGSCTHTVNYQDIYVPKVESTVWSMEETDRFIDEHFGRNVVVVGASTGTDAHTVGIDAIMNMKGFAGHYGLERYERIDALNMGSQVPQTVTQKDVHIKNMTELVEMLEAEGIRDKVILVCGGPRITHELAKELGYDAGFGANTYADDVASYIVQELARREQAGIRGLRG